MAEVDCHNCGTTFDKKPANIKNSDRHFCTQECYWDFGRPDMQGENSPNYKGKVTLECEACGDEFEVHNYRKDTARFCGRECKDDYHAGKIGPDSPRYKGAKETYECLNCGDEFEEYPYRNDGKYCSESCYREAAKELFAGENNPVWRGGHPDFYGDNWQEQRRKALERDDHTCQKCGTHADDMDRSPDIHHKKRLGWFKEEYDSPEWWQKANRLENLETLCQPCHMEETWKSGELD